MIKMERMNVSEIQNLEIDYKKLRQARNEKGLTQSEVAKVLGLDRRQVWQYENGVSLPLENFTKLAIFYGKPLEFFLK
jgi:transcriptional regulator with XRE-family HTH domain